MKNTINVKELLPEEIEELIHKLTNLLEDVKCKKNTISRCVNHEKNDENCPYCSSSNIIKNGHDKNGVQTYECHECFKRFNSCTKTVLAHSKLTYEQIVIFFECMNDKLSIRKTAAKMRVNKNTVFMLRHKVLDSLREIRLKVKLQGDTEADETYESINLKGTKPKDMPRFSKHRSSKGNSKRGISDHKVCIASAIDEYDNSFMEIVGNGQITKEEVKKTFQDKLGKISHFITDCKSSYEKFAHDNNLTLEQVKSGTYTNSNNYNLNTINSLHSELATFLSCFRGVSTKHLQHYLDWFCFHKYINYTVEILKQPSTIMKQIIVKLSDVNSTNVFDNTSGIDFFDVYKDYNYSPPTI